MSIVYHDKWETHKGLKDAARHQEKIDDAIRRGVRNVIGNESILTGGGKKKKVRVAVTGFKNYEFRHAPSGKSGQGGGIGQSGDAKPGDVIARRPAPGGEGQGGGEGHGGDMEVEVDLDYLLDIMFRDLGLPWLDPKKKKSIEVPKGFKFDAISKKGVWSRLHKKRTVMEAVKRNVLHIKEITDNTECSRKDAAIAIQQAKGSVKNAIQIIKNNELDRSIKPSGFVIDDDDLRFKQIEEDIEICSKAVVFAIMDVSASMTADKKYLVKSLLFWMVSWLRKQYEYVDIRFIQHTEIATEVDEDTFFYGGETGGTKAASAFDKMNKIITAEYPEDEWNVYPFYSGDGEDFEPQNAISAMEDTLEKKPSMMSYIEVKPDHDLQNPSNAYSYGFSTLLPELRKKWKFDEVKSNQFWINKEKHFLLSVIKTKKDIWPCIQHMLGMDKKETSNDKE